jgi:hypothetical protein
MKVFAPENFPAKSRTRTTSNDVGANVSRPRSSTSTFSLTSVNDTCVMAARPGQRARTYMSSGADLVSWRTSQLIRLDARCLSFGAATSIEGLSIRGKQDREGSHGLRRVQERDRFSRALYPDPGAGRSCDAADAALAYGRDVRAPHKAAMVIDGGRFACFTNSRDFVAALRTHVLPLAR